jgi:hypothetical protein
LINPGSATVCDCGWSFVSSTLTPPPTLGRSPEALASEARAKAKQHVVIGGVLFVVGLAITVGTSGATATGSTAVIAYGPMIFGLIRIVRGVQGMSAAK